jgi:hypothetical protein
MTLTEVGKSSPDDDPLLDSALRVIKKLNLQVELNTECNMLTLVPQ